MRAELTKEKFLSKNEHDQLQATLTKHDKVDFRNTTFIWMLLHTGARVTEVLNILAEDLVIEGNLVSIRGLKKSKDRELPLYPYLFNRMIVLANGKKPTERVFEFGYHRARDIWSEYRPVKKKIHSLRHTRAMEIYRKTKDVRLVQKVLGHRFLSTTMIYLDYEYTQEELRRAML